MQQPRLLPPRLCHPPPSQSLQRRRGGGRVHTVWRGGVQIQGGKDTQHFPPDQAASCFRVEVVFQRRRPATASTAEPRHLPRERRPRKPQPSHVTLFTSTRPRGRCCSPMCCLTAARMARARRSSAGLDDAVSCFCLMWFKAALLLGRQTASTTSDGQASTEEARMVMLLPKQFCSSLTTEMCVTCAICGHIRVPLTTEEGRHMLLCQNTGC